MNRGDIVIAAERGRLRSKPRPWLIVQADAFNPTHSSITVAMVTSQLSGLDLFAVPLEASVQTGLDAHSEVRCDKLATISRSSITRVAGRVDEPTRDSIDAALRRWLDL